MSSLEISSLELDIVAPLHPDPAEMAVQANLSYVDENHTGYVRKRRGRGFTYVDARGKVLRDRERLAQIHSLVIPPAWTDVWICADPTGHIQATGRDEKGRKQYIYHTDWEVVRDQVKFNRLLPFGEALPKLREQIDADLRGRQLTWHKVAAIALELLDKTRLRIGNPEYTKQNESYGLTTLQDEHVEISGDTLTFLFKGKSGKQHEIKLRDRRLARLVRRCQDLPGQELFQYIGEDGEQHVLRSNDVNLYLREATGLDFTAKDFRTWGGTVATLQALCAMEPATSESARKRAISQAIKVASKALGNTTTVCRKYYVHPAIIAGYTAGTLLPALEEATAHPVDGLDCHELAVLHLLRAYAADGAVTAAAEQEVQEALAECT